jgi:hypothetical protein
MSRSLFSVVEEWNSYAGMGDLELLLTLSYDIKLPREAETRLSTVVPTHIQPSNTPHVTVAI